MIRFMAIRSTTIGQPVILALVMAVILAMPFVNPAEAEIKVRPLSEGWYRMPYGEQVNGQPTDLTGILHNGGNIFENGHNGYDLLGLTAKAWDDLSPHRIVAMADGRVVEVEDGFNACSDSGGEGFLPLPCTPDLGGGCPCNNKIWIKHPNGEFSAYYHIAFNSARVQVGDCVIVGQHIADEGDVGSTGSFDGNLNRDKRGCTATQDPSDFGTPFCGMHLHFAVSLEHIDSMNPDVIVIPRICSVPGHVINNGSTPVANIGPCNAACDTNVTVSQNYFNSQEVVTAGNTITTSGGVFILNSSIGYEAGHKVSLKPGFAVAVGAYFRASIGACNQSNTGCP